MSWSSRSGSLCFEMRSRLHLCCLNFAVLSVVLLNLRNYSMGFNDIWYYGCTLSFLANCATWVSVVTRYGLGDCRAEVPGRAHIQIDPGDHPISFWMCAGV